MLQKSPSKFLTKGNTSSFLTAKKSATLLTPAQTSEKKADHLLLPENFRNFHGGKFKPLCVMFIGRRGGGKSLTMTATARNQQKRYKAAGVPMRIASNYQLNFADIVSPYLVEELIDFPPWGEFLFICIDEAAANFPSRRSMSGLNLSFSNFLTQIRKRNCEICFTTQFPQVMDYQVLLQVDLFIKCFPLNNARSVKLEVWDWWGQFTGNDYRKPWPPEPNTHDWSLYYHQLNNIWGLYNTEEVVPTAWHKKRDSALETAGWIGEEDAEPAYEAQELVTAPKTLHQLVTICGPTFSLMAILEEAKRLDSNIKSLPQFREWLNSNGYECDNSLGQWVANRTEVTG